MRAAGFAIAVVSLLAASIARADITYVVQRGHTLEAIARRYRVSAQALLDANHLRDGQHLKPGQILSIPGVEPSNGKDTGPASNVVHAVRLQEEFRIRVRDARGKVPPSALADFARLMRQGESREGRHPPDPKLVAMVGVVSDHFRGRTLEVVSGYRAYRSTQYTMRSNHNEGKALDFRIVGVKNEDLRDFCLTLRNVGCGYYPNSTFVHLDVRSTKAYWVDLSHPGEPPHYEKPGAGGDHGASDVPMEK
jgi:uncharacterized protein YcbK (DUF882 family)